ncbi:MAG: rRNA maturation RNase YbeY [Candidatus Kapaibacteriota bacterium]|jgi:rRNA maturation RNase YbeY
MEIQIFNETNRKRIPRSKIIKSIANVFEHFGEDASINVVLLTEEEIRKMNKEYLGHDYVTDVISFNLSDGESLFGEVYICLEQAERQAREYSVTFENELIRLAIHGVLHILGFDDDTLEKRNEMHKLEDMFLNKIE